jgi:putative autotransporter adhesin-like protein
MKTAFGVLAILVLSPFAAASAADIRSVAAFEAIEIGGSIDLTVLPGSAFRVEVESPGGAASEVLTEVRNGTLHVQYDRPWYAFFVSLERHRHTVHVTLPRLVALTASGGSHVSTQGTVINGDKFELRASGGTRVTLEVSVATLDVRTSGGSKVRLTGSAGQTLVRTSGGSDVDAGGLKSGTARLSSSGGSHIEIGESATLVVNASGGARIRYGGEPRSLTVNTSGGAGISHR